MLNPWLLSGALLLVLAGCTVVAATTGSLARRAGAQNFATLLICLVLLLLAQGFARPSYSDAALVLALLGPAGTLVYARLLGPELPATTHRGRFTDLAAVLLTFAVVLPLCVAAGPGRAAAKLLVTGILLLVGNLVGSSALRRPARGVVVGG
ncbi:monovalent cation/H+ antiporter complex subunit F [Streptomyces sp. NPDC006971]|uniref:monovalent cation/H+ antiporter complex subunit F n=1 Tax=Streptomyces sp. NPDC006971 TaxID=3154784 RepID=UPI00340C9127